MADDFEPVDDFEAAEEKEMPEDVPGIGGTILTKFAHGAAGELPAKAGAAISAALGMGPEETFGGRYEAALAATKRREEAAAREHPVVSGFSEAAGTIAPYIAGAGWMKGAATVPGMAARGAALSGAQSFLKEGIEGVPMGAAMGAAGPLAGAAGQLVSKVAPIAGKAIAVAPSAYGYYQGGKTLLDPEATLAEKAEAFGGLLADVGTRGVDRLEKKAGQHEANRRAAVEQVERAAREDLQKLADDKAKAGFDEANRSRREAEAYREAQRQEDQLNKQAESEREQALGEKANLELHEIPRLEQEFKVKKQAHDLAGRELAERRKDIMNQPEEARRKFAQEEDDWLKKDLDLDAQKKGIEQQQTDEQERIRYESDRQQHDAEHRAKNDEFQRLAKEHLAVSGEEERLRSEFTKQGDLLRKKLAEAKGRLRGATESAQKYFDAAHGELFTRLANYLQGARLLGEEPSDEAMEAFKYLYGKRESLNPEKMAWLEQYRENPAKAVHSKSIEKVSPISEEIARLENQLNVQVDPDFRKQAIENIEAEKRSRKVSPAALDSIRQIGRRIGLDIPEGEFDPSEKFPIAGKTEPTAPQRRPKDYTKRLEKVESQRSEVPTFSEPDISADLEKLSLQEQRQQISTPEMDRKLHAQLSEVERKLSGGGIDNKLKAGLEENKRKLLAALGRIRPAQAPKGVVAEPEVQSETQRRLAEARKGIEAGFERAMVPGRTIPGQLARDVIPGPIKKIPILGGLASGESAVAPPPESIQSMLKSDAGKYANPERAAVALQDIQGMYRKPQAAIEKGIERVGRPVEKGISRLASMLGKKYQPAAKTDLRETGKALRTAAALANIKRQREIEERKKRGGK